MWINMQLEMKNEPNEHLKEATPDSVINAEVMFDCLCVHWVVFIAIRNQDELK